MPWWAIVQLGGLVAQFAMAAYTWREGQKARRALDDAIAARGAAMQMLTLARTLVETGQDEQPPAVH